jgi:hypothetical protein
VLIRPGDLARIRDGEVDLAFRRWERPRVRVGTKMRTVVGLVEVTALDQVRRITTAEARRAGAQTPDELLRLMSGREPQPIWRIGLRFAGADPRITLRADAAPDKGTLERLTARLDRLDRASTHGAWTRDVLALIAARPEVRAPDLAASMGRETAPFKRDVRKLKELGLTESLPVGYRISPRGMAVLKLLDKELSQ